MPWPFRTLVTMALHNYLSFLILSNVCLFTIPRLPIYSSLIKLVKVFLLSLCHLTYVCQLHSFLTIWTQVLSCPMVTFIDSSIFFIHGVKCKPNLCLSTPTIFTNIVSSKNITNVCFRPYRWYKYNNFI